MKRPLLLLAMVLLASCEAADVWTPETCNEMLQDTVDSLEEQKTTIGKMRDFMENAQRTGNAAAYETQKKALESLKKEGVGGNLRYIDEQVLKYCDRSALRPDLLSRVDPYRSLVNGSEETFEAEGMPDIRVTGIEHEFIPMELNDNGECSGPYVKLTFIVTNLGSDYPRPVDLQTYIERAQQPAEKLSFFTMYGELNFGAENLRHGIEMTIGTHSGAMLKSGASIKIPAKIRLQHDEVIAHAMGWLYTNQLLKTQNSGMKYETDIELPMWDIYTESHKVLKAKDAEGKVYVGAAGTVTNKGQSPTPGPIFASFILRNAENGQQIDSWSGVTPGPVSGSTTIYQKLTMDPKKLPPKITVDSVVTLQCPKGKSGYLVDGNAKNNTRTLEQQSTPSENSSTAPIDY